MTWSNIFINFKKLMAGSAMAMALVIGLYLAREPLRSALVFGFDWIDSLGPMAAVAYFVAYVVGLLVFLPSTPFLLAGGALFGLWKGVALAVVANTVGGSAAFLLARTRLRERLQKRLGDSDALQAMEEAIVADGLRTVMLIRMVPILPAPLVNYGLGLSPARFRHYLLGVIALVPIVVLNVYYGAVMGELLSLLSGRSLPKGGGYYSLLAIGLIATFALVYILSQRMRRIMDRQESSRATA